jgi:hypothetical protein
MIRKPHWPNLLTQFIEERRSVPFVWGQNDCCLFAADWVERCTGFDPAAELRGKYSSALSAARILEKHGGVRGIIRTFGEPVGLQRIDGKFDQRGDLVVADTGNGESIGISIGTHAAFVGARGILFAPFDFQKAGFFWRV